MDRFLMQIMNFVWIVPVVHKKRKQGHEKRTESRNEGDNADECSNEEKPYVNQKEERKKQKKDV